MIERQVASKTLQFASQYPVVTITGPRQSGKTTLCRMLFEDKQYVSLEDIDERQYAEQDPRGFLNRFPDGAVIDEIQRVPDLLSYIQTIVDKKQKEGLFIIFRDNTGNEVDVIYDQGQTMTLIEIKSGQTITSDFFKGLRFLLKITDTIDRSCLVYGGQPSYTREGVEIVGWRDLHYKI